MPADLPLDAYSQVVSGVAAELTPKVASLRVPQTAAARRARATDPPSCSPETGSCSPTPMSSGEASGGTALFADGTSAAFTVVGADPLSDLAVVRATGPTPPPAELGEADRARGRPARGGRRQPARAGRLGDRGRRQRARAVAADAQRRGGPAGGGRDPDRRRAQPGELGRCAGRRALAGGGHQHGGGRHRARSGRPGERHHPADHLRADAARPGAAGVPGAGQRARAAARRAAASGSAGPGPAGRGGGAGGPAARAGPAGRGPAAQRGRAPGGRRPRTCSG